MDKRFIAFLTIALALLIGYQLLLGALGWGPKPAPPAAKKPPVAEKKQPADGEEKPAAEKAPPVQAEVGPADVAEAVAAAAEVHPERRISLGSLDPASPYQMLVTIASAGAAVERIELNESRYGDLPQYDKYELKGGYLGNLALKKGTQPGAEIAVVGPGTPAAKAGLQIGDVITRIADTAIKAPADLQDELTKHKPGATVELSYVRAAAAPAVAKVTLAKHPLSVVRPEQHGAKQDPLSFLLDLGKLDGKTVEDETSHSAHWEVVNASESAAEFRLALPAGLVLHKRYELVKVTDKTAHDPRGYEIKFQVAIENPTEAKHTAAYRLLGPTGLPTEAWWYGSKISPEWRGGAFIRDVVASRLLTNNYPKHEFTSALKIAADEKAESRAEFLPLRYAGIDAQYFAVVLTPQRELTAQQAEKQVDPWFDSMYTLRVGPVPENKAYRKVVDTSFRLLSNALEIPAGQTVRHDFQIFAGPKYRDVLTAYGPADGTGLGETLVYGWFWWVAIPMSRILQAFHWVTGNWGLSIIMLTVLVRSCMFPISRKQALGAQKMQMLQPEIKKIAEKYKASPEQRMKAQQELFRQHSYNPLAGCLPLFLQMPIFIGLYRSLMVNVELRQASLVPGLDWCSNLAGPDAFWNWTGVMPEFLVYYLGPNLNLLPIVTVGLFLWQQKLFMPPPADEQAVLQQKMMQYMMVFMAYLFYQVASGLCIYFIASSLWGIAERKLLPKTLPPGGAGATALTSPPDKNESGPSKAVDAIKSLFQNGKAETNGARDARRRRERGKKK